MIENATLKRSNRKTLSLTINELGNIIIHAPRFMPIQDIDDFVISKKGWIKSRQEKILKIQKENEDLINCNAVLFLGKRYKIVFTKGAVNISMFKDVIELPASIFKSHKSELKKWLINQTDEVITRRVLELSKLMDLKPASIKIIDSKSKWGMCDYLGNIYINYKLIMLPTELIDYVIIHELSHLIELNHSRNFWKIVESIMENYKEKIEKLKNVNFLVRIQF